MGYCYSIFELLCTYEGVQINLRYFLEIVYHIYTLMYVLDEVWTKMVGSILLNKNFDHIQMLDVCNIYFCICIITSFILSCDNMEKLRRKCETLDKEVQDSASFKDFYLFTFNFAKNPGQKSLGKYMYLPTVCVSSRFFPTELDMAIAYWNIVLRGRFKFLDLWCSFLQVICGNCVIVVELHGTGTP